MFKKIFIHALFIFLPSFLYGATSSICSINTIKEAEDAIKAQAKRALILVDIDDTLLIGKDKIMRNANLGLLEHFMNRVKSQENGKQLEYTAYQTAEFQLVEQNFVSLLEELKKDTFVFGFTSRPTGQFILGVTMEDWTAKKLNDLGIIFSSWNSAFEHFKNGILFCGPRPKGLVLEEFLSEMQAHIITIIMIDDRFDNVQNVASSIDRWNSKYKTNIAFLGFHYKAIENFDHEINEHVMNKQLEYLIKHGRYLSETDTHAMLSFEISS